MAKIKDGELADTKNLLSNKIDHRDELEDSNVSSHIYHNLILSFIHFNYLNIDIYFVQIFQRIVKLCINMFEFRFCIFSNRWSMTWFYYHEVWDPILHKCFSFIGIVKDRAINSPAMKLDHENITQRFDYYHTSPNWTVVHAKQGNTKCYVTIIWNPSSSPPKYTSPFTHFIY